MLTVVILVSGLYPLGRAFWQTRGSTLRHALAWATAAWAAWCAAALSGGGPELRYLALVLTACTGVSILEPRRPGVVAWHAVTAGLLAVLLLPIAQGWGTLTLSLEWALFLSGILGFTCLNYLPTRQGLGAFLLAIACGFEMLRLLGPGDGFDAGPVLVGLAPWGGLLGTLMRPVPKLAFDRLWMSFRDGYGSLWALRVREQFQRAVEHSGFSIRLTWHGAASSDQSLVDNEGLAMLNALLKRFRAQEEPT